MNAVVYAINIEQPIDSVIEADVHLKLFGDEALHATQLLDINEWSLPAGKVIIKCKSCGQYGAKKCACKHCGAPIE